MLSNLPGAFNSSNQSQNNSRQVFQRDPYTSPPMHGPSGKVTADGINRPTITTFYDGTASKIAKVD